MQPADEANYRIDDDLPLIARLIQKFAYFIFFVSDFDPLAIYKGHYKHCTKSKYRFYLRPELRLKLNQLDKYRGWFRIWLALAYWLVFARLSIICLVQLAKYQATNFVKVSSNDSITNSFYKPVIHETAAVGLLKRMRLYYFGGNILSDFTGGALFLYLTVLVSISYSIYHLPRYYKIKPADGVDLRMAMRPEHERARIDLLLWHSLQQLVSATESYKLQTQKTITATRSLLDSATLRFCTDFNPFHSYEFHLVQSSIIAPNASFIFDESLRPARYWSGYRQYWRVVCRLFPVVTLTSAMFVVAIHVNMLEWAIYMRCKIRQLKDERCTFSEALDTAEIYSMFELAWIMSWLATILNKSLMTIFAHNDAQLDSIREMETDLLNMLHILAQFNQSRGLRERGHARDLSEDILRREKEPLLDDALLKLLAKMEVMLRDSRSRTQFMSEQVSTFVVLFGMGIVLALVAAKIEGPDIETLRAIVVRCLWLASNVIMIVCAHEYAKIIRLQRIGWPLVAQLIFRLRLPTCGADESFGSGRRCPDPITLGWLKLVETGCLIDVRNSVRPFGVSMTYERILQMNFYVTSLAALVLR